MKVTAICHGGYLGGESYAPGKKMELPEKKARANLDCFAFVEGHHDMTPAAAQRVRDHYHETGERLDVASIEGSGADGDILVEDIEAIVGGGSGGDEEAARYEPDVDTFGAGEEE